MLRLHIQDAARTTASAAGRDNNFNLIRAAAATAVLISHAFPIARGKGTVEPLEAMLGLKLGTLAVYVFFGISGFFIAKSFSDRGSDAYYISSRALRIYPAYAVVLLFAALIIGPIFSGDGILSYLKAHDVREYFLSGLTIKYVKYEIHGVFENNPYPRAVNGPVWTLYYEAFCYLAVFVAGRCGLLQRRTFPLLVLPYAFWYLTHRHLIWTPSILGQYAELTLPFVIGAGLHIYRAPARSLWAPFAIAVLLYSWALKAGYGREAAAIAGPVGAIWLGFLRIPSLKGYNRLGDYSYGIYLYGWPLEQAVVASWPAAEPIQVIAIALPASVLCAVLSWRFVEAPALQLRDVSANFLGRLFAQPRLPAGATGEGSGAGVS